MNASTGFFYHNFNREKKIDLIKVNKNFIGNDSRNVSKTDFKCRNWLDFDTYYYIFLCILNLSLLNNWSWIWEIISTFNNFYKNAFFKEDRFEPALSSYFWCCWTTIPSIPFHWLRLLRHISIISRGLLVLILLKSLKFVYLITRCIYYLNSKIRICFVFLNLC